MGNLLCRPWPLAVLLCLLALAIRIGFVFEGERIASIRALIPGLDADVYFNAARELRLGGPGDPNFELMACSAPLHAYWLAGWQLLVGESMFAHRVVTAILASLRYVLLFFIALRVSGSRWTAAAGCLLLIGLPAVIHFDTSVLKAANDLTLLSLLLALLILPRPERQVARVLQGVGVGLVLSACFLNQLNTVLYALAVVAFVALRSGVPWRERAEMLAPAAGLFLLTFVLFQVHVNRAKEWSEQFLPHSGVNFLLGYQENAALTYTPLPSIPPLPFGHAFLARLYAEIESGRPMTPAEADQFFMGRAMDSIMQRPGKALTLTVERALASVNDFEIKSNDYVTWMKQRSWILWAAPGRFGLLFVLGCLGLVGLVRRREFALAGLFASLILVLVASNAVTFASYRFRVPMVIPLSLASAAGLRYLAELGRRYRTPQADTAASAADVSDSGAASASLGWKAPFLIRDLVIGVSVVSAASWLTFRPCVPELRERGLLASTNSENRAAMAEMKRGNLAAFEAETEKSAADLAKHIAMLGALYRHSEAFRKAREVVSTRDDVLQANVHYLRYLIWLGRYDEARAFSARFDSPTRLRITRSLHPYERGVYDLFAAPGASGASAE